MRKFIIILLVLALIAGAFVFYFVATTPKNSAGIHLPLTESHLALLGDVPPAADWFALVPSAAVLHAKLLTNPVTREPIEQWSAQQQQLPSPWMIGGGDLAIWKIGKRTSYAIRLDPIRAFLVRMYLMLSSDVDARWDGRVFVINGGGATGMGAAAVAPLVALGNGMANGDALVVQRENARGAFPPIGRPAVSIIKISASEIFIDSRARAEESESAAPITARFPRGAMLAAAFADPPRLINDLDRFLGGRVSDLLAAGGALAIYDVDTGTLLPRPKGVIVLPANDATRAEVGNIKDAVQLVGEVRDTGSEVLVSFDRSSLPLYIKDAIVPAPWPANRWAARIDVPRFLPVAEKLGDSQGLRFAASRIHRAARDLRRWMRPLQHASTIDAADSVEGGVEELKVAVRSQ
ncbi:MAG TPA: hypothetical protein VFN10_23280 [Thermoanaerobaculia bacterium]|nr:hypothetical protein [Thermoanaerobaculia bacterium]